MVYQWTTCKSLSLLDHLESCQGTVQARQKNFTDHQTGVSDIPLTANGERMVKEMAPRMVGEKSASPHPTLANARPHPPGPNQTYHSVPSTTSSKDCCPSASISASGRGERENTDGSYSAIINHLNPLLSRMRKLGNGNMELTRGC